MWEISSYSQSLSFLYSVLGGAAMSLVYMLFYIDRTLFKRSAIIVFFQDILFWIIVAFSFFSFSVVFSNGQIRGYLFLGFAIGFLLFKFVFLKIIGFFIAPLKRLIKKISYLYLRFIEWLLKIVSIAIKSGKTFVKSIFTKKSKNIKIIEKNS